MNRDSSLIILFLVFAFFFVSYSSGQINIFAFITDGINFTPQEEEFIEPINVVWQGSVISVMGGGACLGLKGQFDNYTQAIACLQDVNSMGLADYSGEVTITGKWLGITCAYKNTIFGECVPDVEIESIN